MPEKATHIITGNIITMDEAMPNAEAMAIAGGKILAVGTKAQVEKLADASTKTINAGGGAVLPGFIEPHMHIWVTAVNYDWLDCSSLKNKTLDDVKALIKNAAKNAKPGEWIMGKLFDPSLLPGNPSFTTKDLDPLAPDNPVFILNASMHFAYASSKALEASGVTAQTPEPAGGTLGHFDDGAPNGVLGEVSGISLVLGKISQLTPEAIAKNLTRVTDDAARVGVTTMREAGTGAMFGAKEVSLLHDVQQKGGLKTRISIALLDEFAQKWDDTPEVRYGAGDDYVWIGARKIVTDGSNQGESGYQTKPYLNSNDRGKLDVDPEELKKRMAWCQENGWQLMVHANGDAAVEVTTKAFHEVLKSAPKKDLRHRIEHCSLVNDDALFTQMHEVGVTPSFLINHVYYWGKTLRDNILGADRIHMLDRTAACLKAGVKFTMHSDYNVSPINPLHYIKVAITRTMRDGGEVLEPDQRVTVHEALRAMTIDAAWQINADDRLGSLAPGKAADFVVLDQDPHNTEPETIDQIKITQTWRGGEQTF